MMLGIQDVGRLCAHMGPRWILFRLRYASRKRTGWLRRRLPERDWAAAHREECLDSAAAYCKYRRAAAPKFFFAPADRKAYAETLRQWDGEGHTPQTACDRLLSGNWLYFGHVLGRIGFPPDWRLNPFTGTRACADAHWSQIGDFGQGDIKVSWEPSRFACVYDLVRAYWRTGDESFAEAFWQLVESWREQNPPQRGVNWKCGQEVSLRVMAWCFGLYGFLDAEATTAERVRDLAEAIAVSGHRISVNVDYAVSQKNNHGISEAVGLFTIGSLFPEFTGSGYWRAQGRRLLDRQALELFYEDGAFAQHSLNYQRLALHDYLWAARIAETRGEPFDGNVLDRLYRSAMMLYQLQDAETGQVPCYGHNDGALVLPLNNCDYNDYRPITQAVTYLCSRTRLHSAGKWDEDLLWLFGPDAPAARHKPLDRTDFSAEHGGYYTVRSPEGFTFVRCARFRHRPGQADLLHVDLWWRGLNIARDPGSYSYNAPAPWNGSLAGTAFHNTVTVDGRDQMDLVSRFLWLPWANGRVHHPPGDGGPTASYWEGSHDGYLRLPYQVTHRRCLLHFGDETWAVVDCLTGRTRHSYRLHWLLGDYPFFWKESSGSVLLHTPAGDYSVQTGCSGEATAPSLIRADEHGPRGWISPYYHDRKPALSLDRTSTGTSVWFWTLLGPAGFCVDYNGAHSLSVTREGWRRNLAFTEGADLSIPLIAVVSD